MDTSDQPGSRAVRVLIFSTNGVIGDGITSWLTQTFRLMDKTGLEVDTVAFQGADPSHIAKVEAAGVRVHILPSRGTHTVGYVRSLRRLMRSTPYDIVHVNGNSGTVAMELLCSLGSNVKARIAHSRNTQGRHPIFNALLRPLMNALCTDRLACGREAGRWLFGNRHFTVIPNGKEFSTYSFDARTRTEFRSRLGLPEDTVAVGHVGNFNQQKNHTFLIAAFAKALQLEPHLKLYLVGDGALRPAVEEQVRVLGIAEAVEFTGTVSNVSDYLNAFDLGVLPSLHEGFPNVVVEFQAMGLPSLVSSTVTDECGLTELVSFISLDDTHTWARAIAARTQIDRASAGASAQRALREAGYEANDGAKKLRSVYMRIGARAELTSLR